MIFTLFLAGMLLEVSKFVRYILIFQQERSSIAEHFFGIKAVDWAQLIVDMFSKKLDNLFLNKMWAQNVLQKATVDALIEVE